MTDEITQVVTIATESARTAWRYETLCIDLVETLRRIVDGFYLPADTEAEARAVIARADGMLKEQDR